MKNGTGRWMTALLCGVCLCFGLSFQANAETAKNNTAYRIIDVNSGKPLEVCDDSGNGAQIQIQRKEDNNRNQIFFLQESGDWTYIKTAKSMGVFSVKKSSFKDFAEVVEWKNEGLTSMQWKILENDDKTISFENRNSGKLLDVSGGSTSSGTPLQQYRADGSDSQKFRLEEVSEEEMCDAMRHAENTLEPEIEKLYRLVNTKTGKVVDMRDSSTSNGVVAQLWSEREGSENQMFRFRDQGKEYFTVTARHSHKVLEVGGSSLEASAGVNQWNHVEGSKNQMWQLVSLGDDNFVLCNRNSGMVMDVYSGDLSNGQLITQYPFNGSDAQIFHLEVVDREEYE